MQQKTQKILTITFTVLLMVWGLYTFLYYLGIPVHQSSLLSDADSAWVSGVCTDTVCRGIVGFLPFLRMLALRMQPFLWYGIVSAIVYGIFVVFQWFKNGNLQMRLRMRPWHLYALFVACLWLFFTVFSAGTMDDMPFSRIVEPSAAVYTGITDATLATLKDNFTAMQNAGCLTSVGQSTTGVNIYDMKGVCIQEAFFTRVFTQVLLATFFLFELLVFGHLLIGFLGYKPKKLFHEALVSVGVGVGAWCALLWVMAIVGAYTANVGWALVIAVSVLSYRSVWYWLKKFFTAEWEVIANPWDAILILTFLLVSYLALNFLFVVRPFPIGWDDLGSYINRPRLLVSYGHFIPQMSTFQWEYLTSLGFLLFGYGSYFAATASMIINWTEGLLALSVVLLFGQRFFPGRGRGILAALLYYTLPLVGHFSFADMKIDNAVFFMGAIGLFMLFTALFPQQPEGAEEAPAVEPLTFMHFLRGSAAAEIALAGVFLSLAFAFKLTSAMVFMAAILLLAGVFLNGWAAGGIAFLAMSAFAYQGNLSIARILEKTVGSNDGTMQTVFMIVLGLLGVAALVWGFLRATRDARKQALVSFAIFIAAFGVTTAPWLLYNNIAAGNIVPHLLMSAPNTLSPTFSLQPIDAPDAKHRALSGDLAADPNNAICKTTGANEELDRYWGFGTSWDHYVTLPWRSVMNIDIAGYYVTTVPALLLAILILVLPFFWQKRARWLRWMTIATGFIILQWMLLANGIPWYGIGMFLGLVLLLEAFVVHAPNRTSKVCASILIGFSILLAFGMRMWQYDMQKNLLEYPLGKISAEALQQRTIPWYGDIQQIVTYRHDNIAAQPYVYRVGTFIPYFIPQSLEVLGITDNQLDFFNCLYQERNPQLTLKRLIALGFNSVIFDTNTATIERDEHGSLHQKVNAFVDFLNTPNLGVKIIVNDVQAGIAFVLLPPLQ